MPDDGDQITLAARLHPQHAEAAILVVEGNPLDEAGEVCRLTPMMHPVETALRPIALPQQHRPGIRRHRTAVERRNHTAAIKPFEFELSRNTLRLHRTPHRTLATICRKRIISDSWGRCTPLDEISGVAFITNLEHAGDVIAKSLLALAAKRAKRSIALSAQGIAEISDMHDRLRANLRAAAAVFMTDDVRAARRLASEKQVFRDLETRASEAHLARVRARRLANIESAALHLDVLRDLKQINGHFAKAAYPILKERGELLPSRLRHDPA